jgi:hypothetical protein
MAIQSKARGGSRIVAGSVENFAILWKAISTKEAKIRQTHGGEGFRCEVRGGFLASGKMPIGGKLL